MQASRKRRTTIASNPRRSIERSTDFRWFLAQRNFLVYRLIELARCLDLNILLIICDKKNKLCTTYQSASPDTVVNQLTKQLFERTEVLRNQDYTWLKSYKPKDEEFREEWDLGFLDDKPENTKGGLDHKKACDPNKEETKKEIQANARKISNAPPRQLCREEDKEELKMKPTEICASKNPMHSMALDHALGQRLATEPPISTRPASKAAKAAKKAIFGSLKRPKVSAEQLPAQEPNVVERLASKRPTPERPAVEQSAVPDIAQNFVNKSQDFKQQQRTQQQLLQSEKKGETRQAVPEDMTARGSPQFEGIQPTELCWKMGIINNPRVLAPANVMLGIPNLTPMCFSTYGPQKQIILNPAGTPAIYAPYMDPSLFQRVTYNPNK